MSEREPSTWTMWLAVILLGVAFTMNRMNEKIRTLTERLSACQCAAEDGRQR